MLSKKSLERFENLLEGYSIIYAVISSKNRFVFVTKDNGGEEGDLLDDSELATEFILFNKNFHKEKHGVVAKAWGEGISRAYIASMGDENQPTIVCQSFARTFEFASDVKWLDKSSWEILPSSTNSMQRGIWGCKKIDNDIYMFGRFRKLYLRTGKQQWRDLSDETEHPNLHAELAKRIKQKKSMVTVDVGFLSVDGFSQNDIYACGDGADLWHYDGQRWQRLDPPTNFNMKAVLCAPDGYVYLAGALGKVLKGRYDKDNGEQWQLLKTPILDIIHSLAWFKGKVYIGVSYGLYTIDKDGKVEEYQFPEDGVHQYSFRNVTACDEALLSYGANQAVVFDGEKWEQIIGKIIMPIPDAFL